MQDVDVEEARSVLAAQLSLLRQRSYAELVDRLLDGQETFDVVTASGTRYQIEFQGFWDGKPNDVLRVFGNIDDRGWRAFKPLSECFLMRPDGSFIDE